ncbi:hypothetical protein NDR87_14080 [Nocardia sp. CDC159]|uniref:Uncharacterized protein n=1 Tax=Nocardia pulmonis TaxID=2951408 RepID=A0A9X2EAC0_9NOCA|nr:MULTISPECIES: hypothetical protein [Nocardia]MCM6774448.1 hypothetical protein [Nocardia pulmonis]MCM6787486.1 hypothetical protein [Nocardia sp. CDC159]
MADAAAEGPDDEDVHLRVRLGEVAFDYRARAIAAWHFLQDWSRTHCEPAEVIDDTPEALQNLRRLPCERLFLGP